ncbi:MAG TPA: FkbM family methyltransferase [Aeromicrobium sp.]|nr:FkbM family methyltransferase [Aeromicrobium sp.]
MSRALPMAARRVRQTIHSFDNGSSVLASIASGRLTSWPADLTFRTSGLTLVTPNRPGARIPIYELFVEDAYLLEWFLTGLDRSAVVDIGAHVGCFSIAVAKRLPGAQISAYEATPSTFGYLEQNVSANNLADRMSIHNEAVAGTRGTIAFGDTGPGSGHNGVLHLGRPGTVAIEVPSVTIEDAFGRAGGSVELVKIDAEGAEYDMILASSIGAWGTVRRVVMEYHGVEGHSWEELRRFFDAAGLRVAKHVVSVDGYGMAWLSRDDLGPCP